ncbi:hypothetical protein [Kitasatospora sp. NPDC088346]|uniref:hypothetical protein n=1 Tax=Kitasatospora sp. NPDC088346 TaxID=3364073 RepID=UPI00380162DE
MSGNDLPGSPNWYMADLAVIPDDLTHGAGALTPPDQMSAYNRMRPGSYGLT